MNYIFNNFRSKYYIVIYSSILISFALFIITDSLKEYFKILNNDYANDVAIHDDFFLPDYQLKNNIVINPLAERPSSFVEKKANISSPVLDQYFNIQESDSQPSLLNDSLIEMVQLDIEHYFSNGVKTKKEKFIFSILPLVSKENEKILEQRLRLLNIQQFLVDHKTLNKKDLKFIKQLANEYSINIKNKHKVDIIFELLESVDVIPNSIVLAQAANESGWGSSRFAKEFNALFGEYTFDNNRGIEPSLREDGKKHLIKFFPSINESISSYFKNINTHYAYNKFRKLRYQLRSKNLSLDPNALAKTLDAYAEDKTYVDTIRSIIRVNDLTKFDNIKITQTNS